MVNTLLQHVKYHFLQVNHLIDEAVNTGKGVNIISMLHYFPQTYNLGEAQPHLHADNCSDQNKPVRLVIPHLASPSWPQRDDNVVPSSWAHQVFTQLVFWPIQAGILPGKNWVP